HQPLPRVRGRRLRRPAHRRSTRTRRRPAQTGSRHQATPAAPRAPDRDGEPHDDREPVPSRPGAVEDVLHPSADGRPHRPGREACWSSPLKTIPNVIWLFLSGFWLFRADLLAGVLLCITVIGNPFGIAAFRFGGYALWPFGCTAVERR